MQGDGGGVYVRTFMAKELVINQTHSETRIALVENGEILDFLVERQHAKEAPASVGNIYL